jgi:hypothetical protein
MRRLAFICVFLLFAGLAHAQSPLTDSVELISPGLTVSLFVDFPDGYGCDPNNTLHLPLYYGSSFMCESYLDIPVHTWRSIGGGFDATGAFYQIAPSADSATTGARDIVRGTATGTEVIARITGATPLNLAVDSTNGRVYLALVIPAATHYEGIVVISGIPAMFDTLLTYVPGGTLAAQTPAHPDGFRNADSVQVWTGDLRSMPDWSQAQPLTCSAATSPKPGQVVTVLDTLADPAVGHGRYYLTANVSGADRRLGRQYVNGAFSARDPSSLPVCAP